jgi:hypothetical protein
MQSFTEFSTEATEATEFGRKSCHSHSTRRGSQRSTLFLYLLLSLRREFTYITYNSNPGEFFTLGGELSTPGEFTLGEFSRVD